MSESAAITDRAFWRDPVQVCTGLTFLLIGFVLGVMAVLVFK